MQPSELVIDLNADLGEFAESLTDGTDFDLMRYVSSVNIACGGHAGDLDTMRQTLASAKRLHVAVGAHPSYPDRANFGRVELHLEPAQIEFAVRQQIITLADLALELGMQLTHVKPHGALYHAANQDSEIARALGRAVIAVDQNLIVIGQSGAASLDLWRDMGLRCAAEAFADRAYEPDGSLRKRHLPGALLEDPRRAAQQALSIALRRCVVASDGSELAVAADTVCLHSDTPGALAIARTVKQELESAGVLIRALGSRRQ